MGYYQTPGQALSLKTIGQYALVADGSNFSIYDCSQALGVGSSAVSFPDNFNLLSVYPNPFNSQARINFSLQQGGAVSLQIFDPMGRRIRELLPGKTLTAGDYSFIISADGLPGGKYFLILDNAGEKCACPIVTLK